MVRDSVGIERLGTPTVVIITKPFETLSRFVAKQEGMKSLPLVVLPHPQSGMPEEVIHERISAVLDQIIQGLTLETQEAGKAGDKDNPVQIETETIRFTDRTESQALRKVNQVFYDNLWTDGFPIIPPTEESVGWMLQGTDRDPSEIIGSVAPSNSKATVRNIAINSVMAGAEPEYLPVIIAAVEAITDPRFGVGEQPWGLLGMQTCQGPVQPLLVVNGPLARELKIESGLGALSRGHKANATIGRAVRLVLTNVGGARPGINDLKSQGCAQEFTFCLAEQDELPIYHNGPRPWVPLHVELGFPRGSSTITALPAWLPMDIDDDEDCDTKILDRVVSAFNTLATVPYTLDRDYVLILGATHAQCLAKCGMSKDDIKEYLYANAVLPWGLYKQQYPGTAHLQPRWMKHTKNDDTSIHIFQSPKNVMVIVAGGESAYSQIVRVSYHGVTKEIRLPKK